MSDQLFDPTDQAFLDDPYPVLDELREATPIAWNEATQQWFVTRFSDVADVLRDRRLGHASRDPEAATGTGWPSFDDHERYSLLSLDPPDHTRLRRLLTKVFTPSAVQALRPDVEQLSNELFDSCAEQDQFDVIADYAQPFSVAVICAMLGVPRSDTGLLLDWSHRIVKMYELDTPDDVASSADQAAADYIAYTRELIAQKRSSPDGLLISQLVAVEEDGDVLTEDEIVSTAMVVMEAGHEATVNALGNGTRSLMHHREQWQRLVANDVDAKTAIEELLRYDSPLQLFERTVQQADVEIAGQPVAVGDRVAVLFGSAQRDPRRFEHPGSFDVGRGDTGHIGFGGGVHFCIGAPLARQELEVSLGAMVERFPNLELVEEPVRLPAFVIRGLRSVSVAT
ncbi:MAG: cytochrome P450 [Ilumatobacter sp.]